jgi:putative endonuclease
MKKIFYVYVQSSEGYKYTGFTEDLKKRLDEHNLKTLSKWTKRGNNWSLIYSEGFDSKKEAPSKEKWLKSGAGRDFLKKIQMSGV